MTYTRTFTYEERALELALEASEPGVAKEEAEKRLTALREWWQEMPPESRLRVDSAAGMLSLVGAMVRVDEARAAIPRPTDD